MFINLKLSYQFRTRFHCSLVAWQREYEEFKVRINALVAKAQKVPPGGWIMQDGTPWPGNNTKDHPGMIQVFLGNSGGLDAEGNQLPRLVYVSREKRPGFQHHKKAGAMNALVEFLRQLLLVASCSFTFMNHNYLTLPIIDVIFRFGCLLFSQMHLSC